jgi:hypothetical protein
MVWPGRKAERSRSKKGWGRRYEYQLMMMNDEG